MEMVIESLSPVDWAAVGVSLYTSLVVTILMIMMKVFEATGLLDKLIRFSSQGLE